MFKFFVRDDVVRAGTDECGGDIEALAYYVVAEAPNGRRFAHGDVFYDGGVKGAGQRSADHLLGRIEAAYAAGHEPDWNQFWIEIDPAYGSEVYQSLDGEKFFRNREIEESHEAGEIGEREANDLMMR